MEAQIVHIDDELDEFYAGEKRPLIDAGLYEAKCIKIDKGNYYTIPKLYLTFKIFDFMCFDVPPILFMAMNWPQGKVSPSTKYYQNWVIANGNKRPTRNNRMSARIFKNGMFEVIVETVKPKFPDRKEMPECFHYSIVKCIKRRLPDE